MTGPASRRASSDSLVCGMAASFKEARGLSHRAANRVRRNATRSSADATASAFRAEGARPAWTSGGRKWDTHALTQASILSAAVGVAASLGEPVETLAFMLHNL